jgi:glycosyltransferase involved in cell wall biosynthesis
MRIAFVSTYDSLDIENWSGSAYFMSKALENRCEEVIRIGPLQQRAKISKAKEFFYRRVVGKRYLVNRAPRVLRFYADQVSAGLVDTHVDVVFSPGTLPISYLQSAVPIVYWTDATAAGLIDFYPGFSSLCGETQRDAHFAEQAALSNCRLAIYTSGWAAETARQHYKVDTSKIKVVPFGANVEGDRDLNDIRAILAQKPKGMCKLLFVGVDWYRKGGDIAVDIARSLNALGLKTQLNVLGCRIEGSVPDCVLPQGFISKKTREGQALIDRLFSESHFLLVPSRADCVPVVIAEAASYGLPVVASDVGGISTAVRNNVSGYLLPTGGDLVAQAAKTIKQSMENSGTYFQLAENSFGEYRDRLNWQTAASEVYELLQNIVPAQTR